MSSNVPFSEFLAAYDAYAAPIRSHVAFADSRPEVRAALTDTTRIAFLELISRTNIKDPLKPIWVRVDRTAERLGISEKSVSRTIKMMRANGWLMPSDSHDGRNNQGEYDGREFIVTRALRKLMSLPFNPADAGPSTHGRDDGPRDSPEVELMRSEPEASTAHQLPLRQEIPAVAPLPAADLAPGSKLSKAMAIAQRIANERQSVQAEILPQPFTIENTPVENPVDNPVLPCEEDTQNDPNQTDLSDGVIYAVNKVYSLKEASVHKGAFLKDPEERQKPKLPADLVALQEELDIDARGVCSLMKLAREKGHRLQDVWKVTRDRLLNSGAKNGRAVNYLRFLLNCGDDFSYLARIKLLDQPSPGCGVRPATERTTTPYPTQAPASAAGAAPSSATSIAAAAMLEIAKACRYKRFRHVSQSMVVSFYDGVAEVTRGVERVTYVGRQMMYGLYLGISKGNLVEMKA
jgi:hypothetical protein